MKQRFAKRMVAIAAVFVLTVVIMHVQRESLAAQAQASSAKATDKAMNSRGSGPDTNIKEDKQAAVKNDAAKATAAPPAKGGAKTRGYYDCWVTADNYTPWWIDIYVDGSYRGHVSPWGAGTVNAGAGTTTLYGRADFTDGSYKTWGPRRFVCSSDGQFNWRLDP